MYLARVMFCTILGGRRSPPITSRARAAIWITAPTPNEIHRRLCGVDGDSKHLKLIPGEFPNTIIDRTPWVYALAPSEQDTHGQQPKTQTGPLNSTHGPE